MAGLVVRCSIVLAEGWSDTNRADLPALEDAPEARSLISISEDSWPVAPDTRTLRTIISIEATSAASIRWYAQHVLGLDEEHPSWIEMERQLPSA